MSDWQRHSIAWCGECGNVSVDGINFTRVEGGLECAGCGAVSPHFEYLQRAQLHARIEALTVKSDYDGEAWLDRGEVLATLGFSSSGESES